MILFLPFQPLLIPRSIFPKSPDNPGQGKGEGIYHFNPCMIKNGNFFQKMNNPHTFSKTNAINDILN